MAAGELTFPRSPRVTYLHIAGIAVLALGVATTFFGVEFGAHSLRWLFIVLAALDFAVGGAMLTYHRKVRIEAGTHVVTCKTWVFLPIRQTTYIAGAFERVALRAAGRGRYSVYLEGHQSLFIDASADEKTAYAWAQEIADATGWKLSDPPAAPRST